MTGRCTRGCWAHATVARPRAAKNPKRRMKPATIMIAPASKCCPDSDHHARMFGDAGQGGAQEYGLLAREVKPAAIGDAKIPGIELRGTIKDLPEIGEYKPSQVAAEADAVLNIPGGGVAAVEAVGFVAAQGACV